MKRKLRRLGFGLMIAFVTVGVSSYGQAVAASAKKAKKAKQAKKPSSALVNITWTLVEHTFTTGTTLARDLLVYEAGKPLNTLSARSRNQWNGGSIVRFAQAYEFYAKKLTENIEDKSSIWLQWRLRLKNLKKAGLALRQSALEGKTKESLKSLVKDLQKWKPISMGKAPTNLTFKQVGTLMNTVSGLSTGIEFTTFHRLGQLNALMKKDAKGNLKSLKVVLGNIKFYRRLFKALKKIRGKEKWLPLFVYHAELMYRTTALMGLSHLRKGPKKARYVAKFKKYNSMLKKSLLKANSSFKKFWRP